MVKPILKANETVKTENFINLIKIERRQLHKIGKHYQPRENEIDKLQILSTTALTTLCKQYAVILIVQKKMIQRNCTDRL